MRVYSPGESAVTARESVMSSSVCNGRSVAAIVRCWYELGYNPCTVCTDSKKGRLQRVQKHGPYRFGMEFDPHRPYRMGEYFSGDLLGCAEVFLPEPREDEKSLSYPS